jgi:hypothetical protein
MKLNLLIVALLLNTFHSNTLFGQKNWELQFGSGISYNANKVPVGQSSFLDNNNVLKNEAIYSTYGSGSQSGLTLNKHFDSLPIYLSFGLNHLIGASSITNADLATSEKKYTTMQSIQLLSVVGIGYKQNIFKDFSLYAQTNLAIPTYTRMKEQNFYIMEYIKSDYTKIYRMNFSAGFAWNLGFRLKISDRLYFKGEYNGIFMNQNKVRSYISNYYHNQGKTLEEEFPYVYQRETLYFENIEDVKNDQILFPDSFDPNQAQHSLIKGQEPLSRQGVMFSISWFFSTKKAKNLE